MMNRIRFYFVLSFLYCSVGFSAFEVTPIILKATPSGAKSSMTVTVTNNSDVKTPVQINIVHREPDLSGNEDYDKSKDANDLFQVIPSQIILNPKEKRTVRISYIGDSKLKTEQAFRFIAEEFPIDVSDGKKLKNKTVAAISIVSRYIGSIYVTPEGVAPNLTALGTLEKNKNGNTLVLNFKNTGSAHQILSDLKMKMISEADKKEYSFSAESLKSIGNQNILAGKERRISIPWPIEVPAGPVKISFEEPAKQKN